MNKEKLRDQKTVHQLCRLYGVQSEYTDGLGEKRPASDEALIFVLNELGAAVSSGSDLQDALSKRLEELWSRVVAPVMVVWDSCETVLRLNLPIGLSSSRVEAELMFEDGSSKKWVIELGTVPEHKRRSFGDREFVAKRISIPSGIPNGYHRLTLSVGGDIYRVTVISSPSVAYSSDEDKQWGLFCPTYALSSARGFGAGDLTDLRSLQEWGASEGANVIGTLPLLAAFLDSPFEPSPYSPASRLFWNELFVDPTDSQEFSDCPAVQKLVESPEYVERISRQKETASVDYREQMAVKKGMLKLMAERFFSGKSKRRGEFERFVKSHGEVSEYARFRAVGERSGTSWAEWSERLQSGKIIADDYDKDDENYHLFVQWLSHEQMAKLRDAKGKLYLDLPLGSSYDSYDVWKHRELFALSVAAGAPPDALFVDGQNWGFPPLHPVRLRESGYGYLIEFLRHHMQMARMLRIDHVMGLHRLYWIPKGVSAKEGVYVHYAAEEMNAVVCLESHRNRTAIVGEDLGTVPDYVRRSMERHKFQRMYVLQFELTGDPARAIKDVPPNMVASINTHDTPTFAGFWEGKDIDYLIELGLYDEERAEEERTNREQQKEALVMWLKESRLLAEKDSDLKSVLQACYGYLAKSDAQTVLVNLEDLWLETEPQNVPGTHLERPNWRGKAKLSMEEIKQSSSVNEMLKLFSYYGRSGHDDGSQFIKIVDNNRADEEDMKKYNKTLLTKNDLYLFNEGSHYRLYNHLGAHTMKFKGEDGAYFAVWAPDAEYVSVIGDFNGWNRQSHPIFPKGESGIWEGFLPDIGHGKLYKYFVRSRYDGYEVEKGDPFAFFSEIAPKTASIVWDLDYEWNDGEWMGDRGRRNANDAPISIYELHLGSWKRVLEEGNRSLSYRELADQLIGHVTEAGFTHVELMPVAEHPFFGSWGYQVTGFFSPSSRYGTPQDFMYLIDRLHQAGIGVILDWVPSHFPSDEYALGRFDGTHLYEHADPRKGLHPDWDSLIFNYGRKEVVSFLISNALFWLDKYHADGLRVDGVASMLYLDYSRKDGDWIPNEHGGRENLEAIAFLRKLNEVVYQNHPDVQTIAEESTSFPMVSRPTYLGGLGFGMKWDMGWMHDMLDYFKQDPLFRKYHHNRLTFRQLYANHENFVLALSHDEVVHLKGSLLQRMPGDEWQKFANLRLLYGNMYGQTGKKLLFMGGEFGQSGEWNHDGSLNWDLLKYEYHDGLFRWVKHLNQVYRDTPELYTDDFDPQGFEWIDCNDSELSIVSFIRRSKRTDSVVLIVCNFTPTVRENYRIGCPVAGYWREALNSDASIYSGSGVGNFGGVAADKIETHGRPYSLNLTLPPLSALYFRSEG